MVLAQLESPRYSPPLAFLGNGAAAPSLTHLPGAPAKVSDRVRDETFLWTAAHELRQPLSAMTTAIAVIERDSPSGATAHAIGVLGRQVRQMSRMVDDLMDAARLSSGKVSLVAARFDIRTVMTDVAADTAAAAADRGQQLDMNGGEAPLWVDGDRQRLYQVFSNLLRNAIKFTGPGGRIMFTAARHDSRITVRVRDTGRGIDRQALPRIFDLFVQEQAPGLGGIGVGLSVVREIVSLHQGRVDACSDGIGKGSEFIVTLPASPAPS